MAIKKRRLSPAWRLVILLLPVFIMGWMFGIPDVASVLMMTYLPALIAVLLYAFLTLIYDGKPWDGETRRRKCTYILRGLKEPRCSECGEEI